MLAFIMGNPVHLRVFLSSPGDVTEERGIAQEILRAVADRPAFRGKVTIEIVAWDDPSASTPMLANQAPQVSVNEFKGRPSQCDLTVVILWKRLGTPLSNKVRRPDGTAFESGTVWEYEDACASGKPILVYHRTEKPRIEIDVILLWPTSKRNGARSRRSSSASATPMARSMAA